MRTINLSAISITAALAVLLASGEASAVSSVHGVAFVHGTGDYAGTQTCSGTGTSYKCSVQNAIDNYWTQAEVDSVRSGRPYAVTGQHGGTMTPWTNASPYKNSGSETTTGTAYEVASQLNRFLAGPDGVYGNADDITDLVVVTHSGGSNVIRYIVQHPTINTNFSHVQARLRKIIGVAPPSKGTYLADRVFANDGSLLTLAGSALAGLMGFKDDGTKFIQTSEMTSYNADAAKLVNMSSSQGGVPFYATGGMSTTKCFGVTAWGVCLGIKAGSLGGSNCDSALMDTGLAALHNAFLNANDAGTARNSCSDGFISCASAQAIGTSFNFSLNQDHNQSRRKCNGEDANIAAQVNNSMTGFVNEAYGGTTGGSDVPVKQWDSCGFSYAGSIVVGSTTKGYAGGCAPADLGDGYCDWDCVAVYGHDATPTWTGSLAACTADANCTAVGERCNTATNKCVKNVSAWGSSDDCANTTANTPASYSGIRSSNNPWADNQGYQETAGGTVYATQFTGKTRNADQTTVYFTDPFYGTTSATGYCPLSWIGDGYCDECALAQYGNDGNDCLPGKVSQCGGLLAKYDTYTVTSNPLYNAGDPTTDGTTWLYYTHVIGASVGNGVCDIGECTRNKWNPCAVDSDCATGTCSAGYCANSASTCNTTADCTSGTCVNGGCTTAGTDCSATMSGVAQSLCR